MADTEREVLLSVQHLEQFFKMGRMQLKAVNDVSFDIYKGEVFGLVGESGCGKTTTGRSIIRLYDITGGSVYFRGTRIAAGVRRYKEAIRVAREQLKADIAQLKQQCKQELQNAQTDTDAREIKEKYKALIAEKEQAFRTFADAQVEEIKKAKFDHKYCNREYGRAQQKLVDDKYLPLIEQAGTEEEKKKLTEEYKKERALAGKDRITNKIQMIFQDPIASLDPRMTVREIISEGLVIRGITDKKLIDEKVYEVLDLVGLVPEHAGRYPHEFSGGQRQRIGIARAIVLNPELIIADEPISALDVSIQAQVINLLNDLRDRLGLTILFIAHDLSVVKYFSDRIAVMYFGNLVELTTSDELFAHPLHPYTKSLLSAIPVPDPHYEKQRKRITYNPIAAHDYSVDLPSLKEVVPGHFVHCNDEEFERYRAELEALKFKDDENKVADESENTAPQSEVEQAPKAGKKTTAKTKKTTTKSETTAPKTKKATSTRKKTTDGSEETAPKSKKTKK